MVSEDKYIAQYSACKRWVDFEDGWIEIEVNETPCQVTITPPVKEQAVCEYYICNEAASAQVVDAQSLALQRPCRFDELASRATAASASD